MQTVHTVHCTHSLHCQDWSILFNRRTVFGTEFKKMENWVKYGLKCFSENQIFEYAEIKLNASL